MASSLYKFQVNELIKLYLKYNVFGNCYEYTLCNRFYKRRDIYENHCGTCDSFKGSLTANQAAEAMAAGIHDYDPTIETLLYPVADGGEGTVNSLVSATDGKVVTVLVHDPLGRK